MSLDTSGLRGKRVLITGASRGIGAEAARAFAKAGAQLGLAARSCSTINALAQELMHCRLQWMWRNMRNSHMQSQL